MNTIRVIWPLWSKVYAVAIAAPMIAVSLGIGLWLIVTRFDGRLAERPFIGVFILMSTFMLNFILVAWLFYSAIRRLLYGRPEALLFAATGHIMVAIPAGIFLVIDMFRNHERFINDLFYAIDRQEVIAEMRLMVWVVLNIYFALLLALGDNTSFLLENPKPLSQNRGF